MEVIGIKAQYSIEFILVFAFSLIIIIPIIGLLRENYMGDKEILDESQAKKVLDDIAIAAHSVYYSGYPTRTTLDLWFPRSLLRIHNYVVNTPQGVKSELVFITRRGTGESSMVALFPFRVNVTLTPREGRRKVMIKAEKAGYVNITEFRR